MVYLVFHIKYDQHVTSSRILCCCCSMYMGKKKSQTNRCGLLCFHRFLEHLPELQVSFTALQSAIMCTCPHSSERRSNLPKISKIISLVVISLLVNNKLRHTVFVCIQQATSWGLGDKPQRLALSVGCEMKWHTQKTWQFFLSVICRRHCRQPYCRVIHQNKIKTNRLNITFKYIQSVYYFTNRLCVYYE